MNRRQFSLVVLATTLRSSASWAAGGKVLMLGGSSGYMSSNEDDAALIVRDVVARSEVAIKTGFNVHSIADNKTLPGLVLALPKVSTKGGLVDIGASKIAVPLVTPPGLEFSGHGILLDKLAVCSAYHPKTKDGHLLAYDLTGKLLHDIPSGGKHPHEMHLFDDSEFGKVLCVANGDEPCNLAFFDLQLKLKKTFTQPKNVHQKLRHFVITPSGQFGVAGLVEGTNEQNAIPKAGQFVFFSRSKNEWAVTNMESVAPEMARVQGSFLSIVASQNLAALTDPVANALFFWDFANGKFVRHFQFAGAQAAIYSSKSNEFFVAATTGDLRVFDGTTAVEIEAKKDKTQIIGSHGRVVIES
jgi:hypothetical protein